MKKKIPDLNKKKIRITLEQYNQEIETVLKEINSGDFVDHELVVEQSKKWIKRTTSILKDKK